MDSQQKAFNPKSELLTIGAMARLSGVTVRTLRYYEEMDLIGPVTRSAGQYRLYNPRALKRIEAILALQALNYSLEEILVTLGPYTPSLTYSKGEQITSSRQSLLRQQEFVEQKLASLQQMKQQIQHQLTELEMACEPCLGVTPDEQCRETCSHRKAHID